MEPTNAQRLGRIYKFDRCRRYFPRYDQDTFLEQINYTGAEILDYFPQRFIDEHQDFKKIGNTIKIGFWVVDILFVSFCHKIRLLSKILGEKTWKMFVFKIALIAFPLRFMERVEQDAKTQFYKNLYRNVHKFYRRYKQTGDILDLNQHIILEENETPLQKICHLNQFNLVHGYRSELTKTSQSEKVV